MEEEKSIRRLIEQTCAEITKVPQDEWLFWAAVFTRRLFDLQNGEAIELVPFSEEEE